ncbi:MAG TPA: PfkB family carbohydrate kinase, partial [Micromonosporaceae bacterium]
MSAESGVALVIIGHFGFAEDHTPSGSSLSYGGSGYACAVGAGAGDPGRVGVVAHIGADLDLDAIVKLGVDTRGAVRMPGLAPRLTITQHSATERSFRSELGVAATPATDAFPIAYASTRHVHLATTPPSEQLHWLRTIRQRLPGVTVSVDMFEATAAEFPDASRELCRLADLVFANEAERRTLFTDHPLPTTDMVLKNGAHGATLHTGVEILRAPAPACDVVDTTGAGEVLAGAFLS